MSPSLVTWPGLTPPYRTIVADERVYDGPCMRVPGRRSHGPGRGQHGGADVSKRTFACDNPPCVNPAHLKPVTNAENVRRALQRRWHP